MTYQNPQGRIEGFEVTNHRARMSGYWDVTDVEDDQISLDRVVVLIVAARSEGVAFKITDTGDVDATRVLRVSDAVPLTGDLRERAIQMLADRADPNQEALQFPGAPPSLAAPAAPPASSPALAPSQVKSPSTPVQASTSSAAGPSPSGSSGSDVVDDDPLEDNQDPGGPPAYSDPTVVDHNEEEDPAGSLGSVYPPGHVGKDKHLARFLEDDTP